MQNKIKIKLLFVLSIIFAVCICSLTFANFAAADDGSDKITVTVLSGYSQNDLPKGVSGCTYPIFDYVAKDGSGKEVESVTVSAYYDVNSDTKFGAIKDDVLVAVEDNRFYTEKAGVYVLEYVARNGVNVVTEKVFVEVVEEKDYVVPNYLINQDIVGATTTGNKVYLPDGKIVANDNFGKTDLKIEVSYSGDYDLKEIEIIEFDQRLKYFVPTVNGEYTVNYIITDILGENKAVTVGKTITVTDGECPIFIAPSIPEVYIVDEEYKLPFVQAVQYYNGQIVYVPVSVTFDGQAVGEDLTITPTESGEKYLTFTAKNVFGGNDATLTYNVMVNAVDDEKPFVDRFMKLENFSGFYRTENDEGLENEVYVLQADGNSDYATMSFKNKIAVQFLSFGIGAEPIYNNYEYLDFILTDSKNSSEQLKVSIIKGEGGIAKLYLNGFYEKDFNLGDFATAVDLLEFEYDFATKSIVDTAGNLFAEIKSNADGSEFLGFSSGSVYVKLIMGGITGKSQIKLSVIGSYYISGETTESTRPKVVYETTVTNIIAQTTDIYQTVTVKKYAAFDLLDENVKTYLTITAPDGQVVVSVLMQGDYQFKVEQYGIYLLEYKFVDGAGRSRLADGIIQVIDRVAPTVKNLPAFTFAAKVGATLRFPTIEFEDNCSANLTTWIYLTYGNYQKVLVKNNQYTFTEAGVYTVKYGAVDQAGNRTVVTYTVVCS